jgi:hypothetical protein
MITQSPLTLARAVTAAAAATAALLLPLAGPAHAAEARAALPPGVIQLQDSEPCPPATLCLYRDYNFQGPAYGIGAGYEVDLRNLPMPGGTAENNVSSWVNNTSSLVVLIDVDSEQARPLEPGHRLQEPPQYNDTVDIVSWI